MSNKRALQHSPAAEKDTNQHKKYISAKSMSGEKKDSDVFSWEKTKMHFGQYS